MAKYQKIIISILLAVILVILLLIPININDLVRVIKKIDFTWLVLAFLSYILLYIFRALRFKLLLDNKIKSWRIFDIVCLHNLLINILPLRSGELSYLYLIKKTGQIKTGQNISSLIVARFFDFLAIIILIFISLCFVCQSISQRILINILLVGLFIFLFLIILSFLVLFKTAMIKKPADYLIERTFLKKLKIMKFIRQKTDEVLEAIQALKSKKIFSFLFLGSLSIWLLFYLVDFLLLKGLGLNMGFWSVVFATSFVILMAISPIQGIAGFGTAETGWVIGLVILGFPKETAIVSGFALHLLGLFLAIIMGMWGIKFFYEKSNLKN